MRNVGKGATRPLPKTDRVSVMIFASAFASSLKTSPIFIPLLRRRSTRLKSIATVQVYGGRETMSYTSVVRVWG